MSAPVEIQLNHPFELDGERYDKLRVADYSAIANFECHNAPRVIRSLSHVFGVPRRAIRHLHPHDTARAGEMIVGLLNEVARSPFSVR